jgi:hypothetical protein
VTSPTPSDRFLDLLDRAHASESPEDMAVLLDCAMAEGLTLELPPVRAYPGARPAPAVTITPAQIAGWSR